MLFLNRQTFLIIWFVLLCFLQIEADSKYFPDTPNTTEINPSIYVSDEVWMEVRDFLMPKNHPIKKQLDQIFSRSRALCDKESMKLAGFYPAKPQHHTKIIVTTHPELTGYVIKAYLDDQEYHSNKPEHYFWIKRSKGARLIREFITTQKYENYFKVPKKWIYLLPDEPSPPSNYLRKMFILVEEDMELVDKKTNKKLWGSECVTEELLTALFTITTELGLFDCTKPDNCPFSIDGKVAFIDTQSYHKRHVKYHKLTPYLSPPMQIYWQELIKNKEG